MTGVIVLGVIVSIPCIPLLGVGLVCMCDISSCRCGTAFGFLDGSHHHSPDTLVLVLIGMMLGGSRFIRLFEWMDLHVLMCPVIYAYCHLAVSWVWHVVIVSSSLKFFPFKRYITVSEVS